MAYEVLKKDTPRIRGVLFDMDGLVLDTEKLYTRFWMEACHFYGFPMTREQALRMRSANARLSEANLHEFFGPAVDYRKCRAKRIELMDRFIEENGVELKPGVMELLDYLAEQGIATAITSSSPMERIRDHLGSKGLDARFDRLCSGHDLQHGKPAPDIYLCGAASLNLKPEECLALEDSPVGIESAWRANCHPVVIPDQDTPDELTLSRSFARANSLLDVIDLLESLPRAGKARG